MLQLFLAIFAAILFFVNNNATQKSELKQDNLLIQENIENKESIIVPNLIGKSFDDLQKILIRTIITYFV